MFKILVIWSGFRCWMFPPAVVTQAVHLCLFNIGHKSPNYVLWEESCTACMDQLHPILWPDMCHLDLPIRNLSCYTFPFRTLSIVYIITDMVMVDQSGYCWLITTKSACYSSLGNPPTIIPTTQRRSPRVKRRIIKIKVDQTVFGFCFIGPIFYHVEIPYFLPLQDVGVTPNAHLESKCV